MLAARDNGGIAATSDTWTDGFKHLTYICVVAHINIVEADGIKYHRIVLNTSEITELVKSSGVIVGTNKKINFIVRKEHFCIKLILTH